MDEYIDGVNWSIDIARYSNYKAPNVRELDNILFGFPGMQDYEVINMAYLNSYNVYRIEITSDEIPSEFSILRAFRSLSGTKVIAIDDHFVD